MPCINAHTKELQWSARFEAIRDGHNFSSPPCPEHYQVRSASHVGKKDLQRHQWIPPHCRPPPPTSPPRANPETDERLLYLALYRDKVALHHASLESHAHGEKGTGMSSERRARECTACCPMAGGDDQDRFYPTSPSRAGPSSVCVAAGLAIGATACPVSHKNIDDAGSDAKSPSRKQASPRITAVDRPQDGTAHIAAVSGRAAWGGVAEEHLQGKQLGKLFDQWCEQQEEPALADNSFGAPRHLSCSSSSPRRGTSLAPSAARLGHALLNSPRRQGGIPSGSTSRADPTEPEIAASACGSDLGSRESGRSKLLSPRIHGDLNHPLERRKVERLFSVITNSKVRVESFAEKGIVREPIPEDIEGFPQFDILKLHQGPWRTTL